MQQNNKATVTGKTTKETRRWRINSLNGVSVEFYPVFEVNEENEQVECRHIQMRFIDKKGNVMQELVFNYLDIYMFIFFISNEELRQGLAARHERKTNYIPYDVQIHVSDDEKASGIARRRIELPVDELTMAIARNEAFKLWFKSQEKNKPGAFLYKNKKKR